MTDGNIDYEIIDIEKECYISSKELLDPNKLKTDNSNKINNNQDMIVFSNRLIKETLKDPKTDKIKKIKELTDGPKNEASHLFFENLLKLKADLLFSSPEKNNQIISENISDNFPYKSKISNFKNFKSFFIRENKDELPPNLITTIEPKNKNYLMNKKEFNKYCNFSEKKINFVTLDSKKIPEKTKIFFPFERNIANNLNFGYFSNFTDNNNYNTLQRYNSSNRHVFFKNKNNKRNNHKTNSENKYTFSSLRELYRNIKAIKTDFSISNNHIKLKESKLIKKKKINNNEHLKKINIKKNALLLKAKVERSANLIGFNEYNINNQLNKKNNKVIINKYEVVEQLKNPKKNTIHLSDFKHNENGDKIILLKELKNRTNINILTLLELSKKKKMEG